MPILHSLFWRPGRGYAHDEFYNEARQLKIAGRSKMSKALLQRAVAGGKSG